MVLLSAITSSTCVEVTIAKLEAMVVTWLVIGEFTVRKKEKAVADAEFTRNSTVTHTSTSQMIHHCGESLSDQHAAFLSQHIHIAHITARLVTVCCLT